MLKIEVIKFFTKITRQCQNIFIKKRRSGGREVAKTTQYPPYDTEGKFVSLQVMKA
jgi:hypothetical protein